MRYVIKDVLRAHQHWMLVQSQSATFVTRPVMMPLGVKEIAVRKVYWKMESCERLEQSIRSGLLAELHRSLSAGLGREMA